MEKVFEIYIKTTPERLWEAITDSEMRRKYFFGVGVSSDWRPGSRYECVHPLAPSALFEGENLVVDPPRPGLHKRVAETLVDISPPHLFYVSCNPESLGRDLKILGARYAAERLVVMDLFPHTDHVETVVRLVRR